MKVFNSILIFVHLLIYQSCWSQESKTRTSINIPTIQQETTSIWRTINDIDFLREQGYTINLPEDELIDSLIFKSQEGTFQNSDFPLIYNLLETKIYSEDKYNQAIKKMREQDALINKIIEQIDSSKHLNDWDFKMFSTYKVVITLYGTGGSYDPDEGIITLFTNTDGNFMNYKNPANTIIHEIVHMGMEESIVKKYNLSHGLKERIVDRFVYLMFREPLPDYRIQNMGDTRIDDYLKEKEDFYSLDSLLSKFVANQ